MTNQVHPPRQLAVITGSKAMIETFSHVLGQQLEDAGFTVMRSITSAGSELRVVVVPQPSPAAVEWL